MEPEKPRGPTLAIRQPLFVEWLADDQDIRHDALAESISSHGALVRVFTSTPPAERLLLKNPDSRQQAEARVVAMEPASDGASFLLRVELLNPDCEFWAPKLLHLH